LVYNHVKENQQADEQSAYQQGYAAGQHGPAGSPPPVYRPQ
jgi:hypothetical protein